jgi:hypothetical protein
MYAASDSDAALYHFFDVLFPNQIDSVVLARRPSRGEFLTSILDVF